MASLSRHKQTYKMIVVLGLVSASLLMAAFAFEHLGRLLPCKLCIWQRWPHALIIGTALLGMGFMRPGFVFLLITAFATLNIGLSGYHVGVEQGFWPGPASCSGNLDNTLSNSDMLDMLLATPVIRCDEVAWSFFGISMAGWNMLFSIAQASAAGMYLRNR